MEGEVTSPKSCLKGQQDSTDRKQVQINDGNATNEWGDEESVASEDSVLPEYVEGWPEWRNKCRKIVLTNSWFERIWLAVIIANCITLSVEDPTDWECEDSLCKFCTAAGHIFTFLFTIECVMKIAGLGFYKPKGAFLKDSWNILDFIIVVSGIASFFAEMVIGNSNSAALTGLRAFRLLRPLKAVQAFPSVRVLVQAILSSLPQLLDVFILYFFFVLTMGIVAIQQWKGLLRYRCVENGPPETFDERRNASIDTDICKDGSWEFGGHRCPWNYTCTNIDLNPSYGKLSFDHIGVTGLTLFTGLTLEGWTDTMYKTMDATTYFASLFWVVLIIFGSMFVLNLTIVIVTEAFEKKQSEMKHNLFYASMKGDQSELTEADVRILLAKVKGQHVSEEEAHKIFVEMDQDGGGTVSLQEFEEYADKLLAARGTAMSGLDKDARALAAKVPGFVVLEGIYIRTKKAVTKFFEPRKVRTATQDSVYQIVMDDEIKSRTPKMNKYFKNLVFLAIILNTISLAVEHYPQPEIMDSILSDANIAFTVIFTLECALKLYGLGVGIYFRSAVNVFDFVIVGTSLADLFMSGDAPNASAFRTFRVLRILKLANAFPSLQRWIAIVVSSVKGAAILTALLGLVVFIVALLGMQLFGGRFCYLDENWDPTLWWVTPEMRTSRRKCGGKPRSHYDDLGTAILTSFQILTGEDWNVVMYNGMRATGDWVAIYFVLYYILGNYLMLNLFIAVLLNNRLLNEDQNEKQPDNEDEESDPFETVEQQSTVARASIVAGMHVEEPPPRRRSPAFLRPYIDSNRSCFLLSRENNFRFYIHRAAEHWVFEALVFIAIIASTTFLTLESPLRPPDHPMEAFLEDVNFVMIWVFLLEMLLKIIAYGFVFHKDSYLRREVWNRLDCFIVMASLVSLLPGASRISLVKIMRTLRPLRIINKSPGMKVVVQALLTSIGPLSNVLLISFLVWLIFGIMGVQVFNGKFYSCTFEEFDDVQLLYPNITNKELCLNNCPLDSCRWENFTSHFDNLLMALIALFEMASLEGWVTVMRLGMDHVGYDQSPQEGTNNFWAVYFLAFIVFGSFFIINLFIGVLIDTYYTEKEKAQFSGGNMFLDDNQKKWVQKHKQMMYVLRSGGGKNVTDLIVNQSFDFVIKPWFDGFITACIVANVVIMAMEIYPSDEAYNNSLEIANLVFIVIFTFEAIFKLIAMYPRNYWSLPWNRFDFTIVILSLVGIIMAFLVKVDSVVSVFRILRLARLLRMVKKAKGIKRILNTLALSLVSLVNVAGILFLMLFVYATLGVRLFSKVKRPEDNVYANFEDFKNAMLLLLRISTGEAWQSIMAGLQVSPPDCDEQIGECGEAIAARIYFCSYTMAGMYILLNLFIAVILDNFSESDDTDNEKNPFENPDFIRLMHAAWDLRATWVNGEPLLTQSEFNHFLHDLQLLPASRKGRLVVPKDLNGLIHKEEAFLKIYNNFHGSELPHELQEKMNNDFIKSVRAGAFTSSKNIEGSQEISVSLDQVAMNLAARFRKKRAMKNFEELKKALYQDRKIEPADEFVRSVVPTKVHTVAVKLPDGEEWVSNSAFREEAQNKPDSLGAEYSRYELDTLLRNYHDNWESCTPEQRQYYNANYQKVFGTDEENDEADNPLCTPLLPKTYTL
eukprot:TRINITY_DN15340_c0_g1_i1.p1 TRINITY_DN15340_c0_g1~~TRINITY_DN15340_c0_g1_i1.p1  ORF type:complete len:1651 (+),score=368.21 TRINITY_DN15340_c0_g1_i1:54-5006(+)